MGGGACSSPHATPLPPDDPDSSAGDPDAGRRDVELPSQDALVFADVVAEVDAAREVDAGAGCAGRADGFNWLLGDDTARCCGGQAVRTTTDANCGVCGIQCNAANSESCQALAGHYFCRGCVASAACWSKCCSTAFTPYSCAASDCAGNCTNTICPAGTRCVVGAPNSSNYCAY